MAFRVFGCVLMTAALLVGCGGGGSGLKLIPVKGTVTKDGKGIEGVSVSLAPRDPKSKAPALLGVTDAEGAFEIKTSAGEIGAPEGDYRVVVVPKPLEFDYSNPGKGPKKNTDIIPLKFQKEESTDLTHTVKSPEAPLEIKIP